MSEKKEDDLETKYKALLAKNKSVEAKYKALLEKNKSTKHKKDNFVIKNLDAFAELLSPDKPFLQKFGKRYCFSRMDRNNKKKENVIKLNKLVLDLLEAKIRMNPHIKEDDDISLRLSMDKGSLIKALGGMRATRHDEVAFRTWRKELKLKMAGKLREPWKEEAEKAISELEELKMKFAEEQGLMIDDPESYRRS